MQLSRDELLRAYRQMKIIREFEERLEVEVPKGQIPGFTHLYSGQEAIAVGVCEQLTEQDTIISTHRGHGHCIAKGVEVKSMMKEIYGKGDGTCGGKGGSMHIADVALGMLGANGIVGGGAPLMVGAALANRNLKNGAVSIAFGGDGSCNQGAVFEAMNLAVVLKVPAIFVFENNGYSEHTGHDYAVGSKDIRGRAEAFGMPAVRGDGTDFFDVYEKTREAIAHCRAGKGPYTLEFTCARFFGHFVGDPQNYRGKGEFERIRKDMDCLKHFRARVSEAKLLDKKDLDAIDEGVMQLIEEAIQEAIAAPPPDLGTLETDVYISY